MDELRVYLERNKDKDNLQKYSPSIAIKEKVFKITEGTPSVMIKEKFLIVFVTLVLPQGKKL